MRLLIRLLAVAGLGVFLVGLAVHQRGLSWIDATQRSAASLPAASDVTSDATQDMRTESEISEPVSLETFLRDHATVDSARDLGMDPSSPDRPEGSDDASVPDPVPVDRAVATASGEQPAAGENIAGRVGPDEPGGGLAEEETGNDPLEFLLRAWQGGRRTGGVPGPALRRTMPHLFVLLVEDLSREDLGAYGQTLWKTPFLDQLASQGLRLTRCAGSAAGPVAERTALWYGDLANSSAEDGAKIVCLARPSLPACFRRAGYQTVLIGDCGWTMVGTSAEGPWNHWIGWRNESFLENLPQQVTGLERDGTNCEVTAAEPGKAVAFDQALLECAQSLLRESNGSPLAVVTAVPLRWWQQSTQAAPAPAGTDWTEVERRHMAAVERLDRFASDLYQQLQENRGSRRVAVAVVGLPRGKKNKDLKRLRAAVPALNDGLPKAQWPYAPVLVSYPGVIPGGRVESRFAGLQDLLPTLLHLTGHVPPRDLGGGESHWRTWTGDERD